MRLKTVYVRFYKSFNYDYLRKNHLDAKPDPWDLLKGAFYPYVRIPLDSHITTVVGANESGKSHLLSAIEKGVSGKGIEFTDFCRYSQFFAVMKDEIRIPDFGLEWTDLNEEEVKKVSYRCGIKGKSSFKSFFFFRSEKRITVYIWNDEQYATYPLEEGDLSDIFPRTFRIDSEVALPDSVSIQDLIKGPSSNSLDREHRFSVMENYGKLLPGWFDSEASVQKHAAQIHPAFAAVTKSLSEPKDQITQNEKKRKNAQIGLARDLILKVARISAEGLTELHEAIRKGNDGHANALIEKINSALAARLNFPRFWVQDRDFSLKVSPREHDLVFTIRDRTGTEYSFKERSSGLKYFLSYYIQYLAHESSGPQTELLLMDEPDAYLSSQAQQDLLKVFHAYAFPEGARNPVQVVFVTHSPFLIDKNHADRIRVLEKGTGEEGTRVVRDASRNHYEPLRSAFGAFVGETTFIGNCNLMVEGTADQIILAGAATFLRKRGFPESKTLDLNRLTIIPAGSVSHIPYLAYLARGRDVERPAVIVLMDSDEAGNRARADLLNGPPKGKPILKKEFILQVGDLKIDPGIKSSLPNQLTDIEDLIPLKLCLKAVDEYAQIFWDDSTLAKGLTEEAVLREASDGVTIFKALDAAIKKIRMDLHINKAAFARTIVDLLAKPNPQDETGSLLDVPEFASNMAALFVKLRKAQHTAEKERSGDRVSIKIDRVKRGFLLDHPEIATRETAGIFLDDLEESLDDTPESDSAREAIRQIRRNFSIAEDILENVPEFEKFREALERIKHLGRYESQEVDLEGKGY